MMTAAAGAAQVFPCPPHLKPGRSPCISVTTTMLHLTLRDAVVVIAVTVLIPCDGWTRRRACSARSAPAVSRRRRRSRPTRTRQGYILFTYNGVFPYHTLKIQEL